MALGRRGRLEHGITGLVAGEMHAGGVSTSAALGVACLLALESANDLAVDTTENVELDRMIENDYIGLENGILDQSVILRARAGTLVHLDCRTGEAELHEAPPRLGTPALLAVYSGVEAPLVATGFNARVAECRRAAAHLLENLGLDVPDVPQLRDVPEPVTEAQLAALPPVERRRARHYVGEIARVRAGLVAWRDGDIARFGGIVTETGRSSIENYECGSPELIGLYELLASAPGSFGARFSGAGFRGYCMAIVDADRADAIATETCDRYRRDFPERAADVHAHVCRWADGAEILSL
jgi:galacturonokinase